MWLCLCWVTSFKVPHNFNLKVESGGNHLGPPQATLHSLAHKAVCIQWIRKPAFGFWFCKELAVWPWDKYKLLTELEPSKAFSPWEKGLMYRRDGGKEQGCSLSLPPSPGFAIYHLCGFWWASTPEPLVLNHHSMPSRLQVDCSCMFERGHLGTLVNP